MGAFRYFVVSPDDRFVASAVGFQKIVLLDNATCKENVVWAHEHGWHALAFSSDGKTLIGLDGDYGIHRWDLTSLKEIARQPLLDWPKGLEKHAPESSVFETLTRDGSVVALAP